jgi:hypothetical protein
MPCFFLFTICRSSSRLVCIRNAIWGADRPFFGRHFRLFAATPRASRWSALRGIRVDPGRGVWFKGNPSLLFKKRFTRIWLLV